MSIKEKYEEVKSNVCSWMDEHPKAALGIKIGAGVAAAGAAAFGCYKIFEAGVKEGMEYGAEGGARAMFNELVQPDKVVNCWFRDPIDPIPKDILDPCLKTLADRTEIFEQGDSIVGLFSRLTEEELPKAVEGFISAGAVPDSIAVLLEADLRA